MMKEVCPVCGEKGIVPLPSMNKKACFCCHREFEWKLKDGQKSILIENLIGGRDGLPYTHGKTRKD